MPKAEGRDLLVSVKAISVNPVDTKVRAPKDKVENPAKILGWDAAGVVERVGPDVTFFRPGDEVFYAGSITRQGTNCEYHLVDERIVGNKPSTLDFSQAAALPLTSITAWESLFDRLGIGVDGLDSGKRLLIIGGAGGVGSIAIQLAKQVARAEVIASASRAPPKDWCRKLGADHVVNHYQDLPTQLENLGINQVDWILCLNKTDSHWAMMAEVIAPQGKICSIVETAAPVNLGLLKNKSVSFIWEMMFTRSAFETQDMVEQHRLLNRVSEQIDKGTLKSTLGEVMRPINAANLRTAHAQLETGRTIGKVVLEGWN